MLEAEGVQLAAHHWIWLERIQACDGSGMTMSADAAEYDLGVGTILGARKALKRKGVFSGGDQPALSTCADRSGGRPRHELAH